MLRVDDLWVEKSWFPERNVSLHDATAWRFPGVGEQLCGPQALCSLIPSLSPKYSRTLEHLCLGPAGPASTGMELDHFRISWTIPGRTDPSCAEAAPGAGLSHWSQQSSPNWRWGWSCFLALAQSTCSHTFGLQNTLGFFKSRFFKVISEDFISFLVSFSLLFIMMTGKNVT